MTPTISVNSLSHSFEVNGKTLPVLSNISLEIQQGSFISVIGPSGCGKTTLLKLIGGLLDAESGSVTIEGAPPQEAQRRKAIGFVFQDSSLLPWRTVAENISLPLELNSSESRQGHDEVDRLLDVMGLAEFGAYHPHELSGGMRQRVALARALATDPDVLLMDEPLGALDEMTREAMRYEILSVWERNRRKTVVFVTHSIAEAVALSHRVIVMSLRPGHILDEIDIDLPHPRDETIEKSQTFLDYTYKVRDTLSKGVVRATAHRG
ncbi:MAG: ABC transporter ATP-binding protein [Chloroflexi bacterium]|nr:ABC transporter ATP-binding protein [Chloroflexota bacterium]MDA1227434.1 ABC transporter ATP-binding protein [Chloroflexota bacterium]